MRQHLKLVGLLAIFGMLSGCELERPDQDNFVYDAGVGGIEPFIESLSATFSSAPARTPIKIYDSDPAVMFTLEAKGISITVQPLADDRCNPNAPMHLTYNDRQYAVDLVYRTSSKTERAAARQKLLASAALVGHPLAKFAEC